MRPNYRSVTTFCTASVNNVMTFSAYKSDRNIFYKQFNFGLAPQTFGLVTSSNSLPEGQPHLFIFVSPCIKQIVTSSNTVLTKASVYSFFFGKSLSQAIHKVDASFSSFLFNPLSHSLFLSPTSVQEIQISNQEKLLVHLAFLILYLIV